MLLFISCNRWKEQLKLRITSLVLKDCLPLIHGMVHGIGNYRTGSVIILGQGFLLIAHQLNERCVNTNFYTLNIVSGQYVQV